MPHTVGEDGLIIDTSDGRPVATLADSFTLGLGEGWQADWIILRLYHRDWAKDGPLVPPHRLYQFALPAPQAAELGRRLLAYAAQVEKEDRRPKDH